MWFRRNKNIVPPPTDPISRQHSRGLKFFIWGLVIIILGSITWVATTGLIAFKNISAKNASNQSSFFRFNGDIPPDQLLIEGDSRINVLSLGIDTAAGLTDSIQVISVDPVNKTLSMVSLPRDLYVTNPVENRKTKINEVYNSANNACAAKKSSCDPKVDAGGEAMKKVVSDVLGVPIQYFTKVNFEGVKRIVDAVGGIDINVEKAIYDPYYPNTTNGYQTFKISAGLQHLDGNTALKYARTRKTDSDFNRSHRQQQVIIAIKQKALTLNILTNPKKITDIINAVGTNFKTDLQSGEITALLKLMTEIDSSKTVTKVIDDAADGPLKSSTDLTGQYILTPKLGENNWSAVQEIAQAVMPEPYLVKEAASIQIINATGRKTAGADLKKKLTTLGYHIIDITDATTLTKLSTIIFDTDKPYTLDLLKRRFNVTPTKTTIDTPGVDIVITIGSSFVQK